ncbi:hypothetical protein PVAND_006947 [Polypedilum vanderplanki]|uniref:Splicing factor YJU2 n=1 Tax=Polypedilum vanderplanki TaxID=319348 RepID=A0A9J6C6D7_POLVA|nr:hypothetical protein PVAND_006947 [Polypedilum vanderplanki]
MSERKVLNKYYPPDFDPSKIPRCKLPKNRQYTVRLMAPFNMRCVTCGEYIYKGKKFNARKEDVENETYLGIRIYRFYIKCTRCLQEISFKTDPQNTDYEIEAGATRNFMALKLAEEQALRELQEAKEEEANNPMLLLENRTKQSRNEIELLESLEELKDLNQKHENIDYDALLHQYDPSESIQQREERLAKLDDEYVKTIKFRNSSGSAKRIVAEEIIEDIKEDDVDNNTSKKQKIESFAPKLSKTLNSKKPLVLIKKKEPTPQTTTASASSSSNAQKTNNDNSSLKAVEHSSNCEKPTVGGLSLLSTYSDSDSNDD